MLDDGEGTSRVSARQLGVAALSVSKTLLLWELGRTDHDDLLLLMPMLLLWPTTHPPSSSSLLCFAMVPSIVFMRGRQEMKAVSKRVVVESSSNGDYGVGHSVIQFLLIY